MKKSNRGGKRGPVQGGKNGEQNAKPVRTGTRDFAKTASKVHPANRVNTVPMRGGIRF